MATAVTHELAESISSAGGKLYLTKVNKFICTLSVVHLPPRPVLV